MPCVPTRSKIASSSASLNAAAPRCNSFSRGRSPSAQSLMLMETLVVKIVKI